MKINLHKLNLANQQAIEFKGTNDELKSLSVAAQSKGYSWPDPLNMPNMFKDNIMTLYYNNPSFMKCTIQQGKLPQGNVLQISFNHRQVLDEWLRLHPVSQRIEVPNPIEPSPWPTEIKAEIEPPKQVTKDEIKQQPVSMTPYEMMVADLAAKVKAELEQSTVNEQRVRELVIQEMATAKRLLITVENKRNNPPTTEDINEPSHNMVPQLLGVIGADCWPALVGPTGSGKTLGVMQVARILKINIVAIKQMTRMIAPHDLIGYMDAHGNYKQGAWTNAILGNCNPLLQQPTVTHTPALIIVDEMDNANENIIMIIKALQTGYIAMPYGMQEVNKELKVVATMNTWGQGATREYVGRMAQDAALLNEFQFIEWNYDTEFEWELLQRTFAQYHNEADSEWKVTHMRQLLSMFIAMRKKAEDQKVRVIISTRNVIAVAKLLLCNKGWSIQRCLKMSVFKGLKDEEVKRVECPEHWTAPRPTTAQTPHTKKQREVSLDTGKEVGDTECPI